VKVEAKAKVKVKANQETGDQGLRIED